MTDMVDTQIPKPGLRVRIADNLARRVALTPRVKMDRPLVSFTFDDVPVSATTEGAAILEEHGVRGTYYVTGSFIGMRTEHYQIVSGNDVVGLHARGHEIGCHSFSHIRVDRAGGNELLVEIMRNRAVLKAIEPSLTLRNFAYPYGFASPGWKRKLQQFFDTSRTAFPITNTGQADPHYLGSIPLIEGEMDADRIERAFDVAQKNKGWTIFYGHDIAAQYSPYGCTPSLLKQAIRIAQRRGIAIGTVQSCWNKINPQAEGALPEAVHAV